MTAIPRGSVAAFLLCTGMVAGILAIVVGIFGMHVTTGNHTMHSASHSPAVAVTGGEPHGSDHTTHHPDRLGTSVTGHAGPEAVRMLAAVVEWCTCSAQCTGGQQMSAACVPSAKTGSLAAPDPGLGITALGYRGGFPDGSKASSYAYVPGSPSPGELSISRT